MIYSLTFEAFFSLKLSIVCDAVSFQAVLVDKRQFHNCSVFLFDDPRLLHSAVTTSPFHFPSDSTSLKETQPCSGVCFCPDGQTAPDEILTAHLRVSVYVCVGARVCLCCHFSPRLTQNINHSASHCTALTLAPLAGPHRHLWTRTHRSTHRDRTARINRVRQSSSTG